MKGVVLAGGTGSRLHSLTGGGNKHLHKACTICHAAELEASGGYAAGELRELVDGANAMGSR